jgi:hypothetical protein
MQAAARVARRLLSVIARAPADASSELCGDVRALVPALMAALRDATFATCVHCRVRCVISR